MQLNNAYFIYSRCFELSIIDCTGVHIDYFDKMSFSYGFVSSKSFGTKNSHL